MKFTDALTTAYQIPWSYANAFEVFFAWNYYLLNNETPGVASTVDYNLNAQGGKNILGWNPKDNERLSLHLKSLNLPGISSNEISSWVGNRWTRANGKPLQYTFDMTFRDSNQMEFYRLFTTQFREQQYRYFDDYAFNVFVSKDSDYGDKYHNDSTGYAKNSWKSKPLMSLKRCSIQGVGAVNFSNDTENQHLEFTVAMVANDIEIYDQGARQFYGMYGDNMERMDAPYFATPSG